MISAMKASVIISSCFLAYQSRSKLDSYVLSFRETPKEKREPSLTKTYIWGNGFYNPKPDVLLETFQNFEPKLIKSFLGEKNPNFKQITFGEYHEGGIDTKGNFYIWNKHKIDALERNSEKDGFRADSVKLDGSGNVKQIGFSRGSAWALRDNGEVYEWQIKSAVKGKSKDGDVKQIEVSSKPKKIDNLKDIVQIATGEDHFIALDKQGNVWTMGDDTYGQCGLGANNRSTIPPYTHTRVQVATKIPNLSNISRVTCGENHSLALSKEGLVYGWGRNSSLQLSHEREFLAVVNPLLTIYSPLRINKNLDSAFVTDIAAGQEHSIVVTKNKNNGETEVFGCGKNNLGQLGIGSQTRPTDVVKIENLSNYKVTTPEGVKKELTIDQIQCGDNHCIALLSTGFALEWGDNHYGQLGNQSSGFKDKPVIITDFKNERVLSISARQTNSAVIAEFDPKQEAANAEARRKKREDRKQ